MARRPPARPEPADCLSIMLMAPASRSLAAAPAGRPHHPQAAGEGSLRRRGRPAAAGEARLQLEGQSQTQGRLDGVVGAGPELQSREDALWPLCVRFLPERGRGGAQSITIYFYGLFLVLWLSSFSSSGTSGTEGCVRFKFMSPARGGRDEFFPVTHRFSRVL